MKFYMCVKNIYIYIYSNLKVIFSKYVIIISIIIIIFFFCVGVVVISYKLACSQILSNLECVYNLRSSIW